MYAEACNELGDDASARDALNQVRRRAKLDDVTASGKALQSAIRLERRLELAFEQNRLYDIRRWTDTNGKKVITLKRLPVTLLSGKIKVKQVTKASLSMKTATWCSPFLCTKSRCPTVPLPRIRVGIKHILMKADCCRN